MLKVMNQIQTYLLEKEGDCVESVMYICGFSFGGRGQNQGLAFVRLKDWGLRQKPEFKVDALQMRAMMHFAQIHEATVYPFTPPAMPELGLAKGFDFQLLDMGGVGHAALMDARNQLLGMIAQDGQSARPTLVNVRPNGMEDLSEYHTDVDWDKAGALGVPLGNIHETMATAFGSAYINNFVQGGRVKRVFVQAQPQNRMLPTDLQNLYTRNLAGEMVPLSSMVTGEWAFGSPRLERFNGFPSINIVGEAMHGRSSGEAMDMMENFVKKLPRGIGYDWQGLSYQERQSGSQKGPLYAFSVLVIFLCLAALYESWPIPFATVLPFSSASISISILLTHPLFKTSLTTA